MCLVRHLESLTVKESKVVQSCPTLYDPMDCSLPGSSVHGIFQARILEWVAISFSRGSSRPRDHTWVSRIAADALPSKPSGKPSNRLFRPILQMSKLKLREVTSDKPRGVTPQWHQGKTSAEVSPCRVKDSRTSRVVSPKHRETWHHSHHPHSFIQCSLTKGAHEW